MWESRHEIRFSPPSSLTHGRPVLAGLCPYFFYGGVRDVRKRQFNVTSHVDKVTFDIFCGRGKRVRS